MDAIQEMVDFVKTASENRTIGPLSKAAEVQTKVNYFKQIFIQSVFIRSRGKADLEAKNILQPSKDKTIEEATLNLRLNSTGQLILSNLQTALLDPLSETLTEIEDAILVQVMQGVKVAEEERKTYVDPLLNSRKSKLEVADNVGVAYNSVEKFNLLNTLLDKSRNICKLQDNDQHEVLLNLLKSVDKQRKILQRIQIASKNYPGLGFTAIAT